MKVLYFWCGVAKEGNWVANDGGKFLIDDPNYEELIETIGILPFEKTLIGTRWNVAQAYTLQKALLNKLK